MNELGIPPGLNTGLKRDEKYACHRSRNLSQNGNGMMMMIERGFFHML